SWCWTTGTRWLRLGETPVSSAGRSSKDHTEGRTEMSKDHTNDAFRPAAIRAAKAVDANEDAMAEMERELMAVAEGKSAMLSRTASPSQPLPYVADELVSKAKLFAQRAALYGNNYVRFGPIMAQLMAT